MRADPSLSVVTISFRDLDGLRRTTESVARQRYPAIEHIVIDGGSGPEVTDYLTRNSPSYWESKPDAGRYDAMNKGISHATGDVVWLMHSGDCFAGPDAAAAGIAALGARPRNCWGYGKARIVGDPAREGLIWGYSPFDLRGFALGVRPIPHQAALFGADLLDRLGPYDTEFGLAADHLYMLGAATVETPSSSTKYCATSTPGVRAAPDRSATTTTTSDAPGTERTTTPSAEKTLRRPTRDWSS